MRTPLIAIAWLGLTACGGQSGENGLWIDVCEGSELTDVATDDATLGYSAEDVVDGLLLPSGVHWILESEGNIPEFDPVDDTLATSGVRIEGQVQIVDYTLTGEACDWQGQRRLRIPLRMDLAIGQDGIRVEDGPIWLEAGGVSPSEIDVETHGFELRPELDGPYRAAFDAWWAARQARYPEVTDWDLGDLHMTLRGTSDALSLHIGVQYDSAQGAWLSGLWEGTLTGS